MAKLDNSFISFAFRYPLNALEYFNIMKSIRAKILPNIFRMILDDGEKKTIGRFED